MAKVSNLNYVLRSRYDLILDKSDSNTLLYSETRLNNTLKKFEHH